MFNGTAPVSITAHISNPRLTTALSYTSGSYRQWGMIGKQPCDVITSKYHIILSINNKDQTVTRAVI